MALLKKTLTQPSLSLTDQRILIIAHNHPDFFPGGGEIQAYQQFQQLKDMGYDHMLFLAATGNISRTAHHGTPFMAIDGRADEFLFHHDAFDYFHQSNRKLTAITHHFANFLKEHQPDVVHFHHTLRFGVEALAMVRQALPDARIIYTLHDFIPLCHHDGQMVRKDSLELCEQSTPERCAGCYPNKTPQQFALRKQLILSHFDLVDHFVAPSHFLADRYIDWGIDADKMHVIDNGAPTVAPADHRKISRDQTRNQFLFIGQVSPFKGTLLLAEAARILIQREVTDFTIHIHGNIGWQSDDYKARFEEEIAALSPYVQWHGRYSHDQLPAVMADADWVVVPSIWWENAPLVIQEAFQHARPVICSDIGGMAEKVDDGITGLHFRANDAAHLADTLERAMHTPQLWNKLTNNIKLPTSMEACAREHIDLYHTKPTFEDEEHAA